MISEKKKKEKNTQPKHKNPLQNPNTLHTFLQILYGGVGCSARTSYRDQVVCVLPSKTLLRSLTFFLDLGVGSDDLLRSLPTATIL